MSRLPLLQPALALSATPTTRAADSFHWDAQAKRISAALAGAVGKVFARIAETAGGKGKPRIGMPGLNRVTASTTACACAS